MEIKGKKICFIGDSITEGSGVTNQENRWDNYLKNKYGIINLNYGISGTRIAWQHKPTEIQNIGYDDAEYFDITFYQRALLIDESADAVIVFGGTNDYGHGDAPIGKLGDKTVETFYGAVDRLFDILTIRFKGKPIIMITPIKREGGTKPAEKRVVEGAERLPLKNYVDAIIEVGKLYKDITVVNAYDDLKINPDIKEDKEKYTADGLHLNDYGSSYFGEFVYGILKNL